MGVHIFNRVDEATGAVIISVSGDVDVAALPSLQSAIDRSFSEGAMAMVLDLGEVDSIDLMGLSLVSRFGTRCERSGSGRAISVPKGDVRSYLLDHDAALPVFAELKLALASLEVTAK